MPTLEANPGAYKRFISEFRSAFLAGGSGGHVEADFCTPSGERRGLRFRPDNFYLTHVRNSEEEDWIELTGGQDSYTQMGVSEDMILTKARIDHALAVYFNKEYHVWRADLAVLIFITAEAARSQYIYQEVQKILQDHIKPKWKDYLPYLRSWGKNVAHRPFHLGPLRKQDYLFLKGD